MLIFAVRSLYIPRRGFGRVDLLYQVGAAVGLGWLAALSVTFFLYRSLEPPRLMLVYWALLSIALVWLSRVVLDALLREAHRRGRDVERVLPLSLVLSSGLLAVRVRRLESGLRR